MYLNELLQAYGFQQENTEFFDTLKITDGPVEDWADRLREVAEEAGFNFYYDEAGWVGISLDETVNLDTMNDLI